MSIDEKVDETNNKISKLSGVSPKVHEFQRNYNPLEMYCRLRDSLGLSKEDSKDIAEYYGQMFYEPLMKVYEAEFIKKNNKEAGK